jgi:hypothetical protein
VKKTVSPAVAIALIVVVVIIVALVYTRASRTKRTQFVPGVGVIDPETGRAKAPAGGRRGRRGGRGGGEAGAGQQAPARR